MAMMCGARGNRRIVFRKFAKRSNRTGPRMLNVMTDSEDIAIFGGVGFAGVVHGRFGDAPWATVLSESDFSGGLPGLSRRWGDTASGSTRTGVAPAGKCCDKIAFPDGLALPVIGATSMVLVCNW